MLIMALQKHPQKMKPDKNHQYHSYSTHSRNEYTNMCKAYQDPSSFDAGVIGQQELIWQIGVPKKLLKSEGSFKK